LKKIEAPKTINYSESQTDFYKNGDGAGNNPWENGLGMNSSVQSFYSERQAQIDDA